VVVEVEADVVVSWPVAVVVGPVVEVTGLVGAVEDSVVDKVVDKVVDGVLFVTAPPHATAKSPRTAIIPVAK